MAVFFPNEFYGVKLDSVSLIYFKGEKFFLTMNPSILKHDSGVKGIGLWLYSWCYLAINESALNDVEVVVNYSWPPSEDGSVALCGPEKRSRLGKIINGV